MLLTVLTCFLFHLKNLLGAEAPGGIAVFPAVSCAVWLAGPDSTIGVSDECQPEAEFAVRSGQSGEGCPAAVETVNVAPNR